MAELGRWINKDPIGEKGGNNLHLFVGNNPIMEWDYLGMAWSSDKGVEALLLAEQVSGGTPLPAGHQCCASMQELSMNSIRTADCITFVTAVMSCGYRLNGDSASADSIASWYRAVRGLGSVLAERLIANLGWKAVFYDRDFEIHRHSDPGRGRSAMVAASQVKRGIEVHGMNAVGAVTDFAPYNPPTPFSYPASYNDLTSKRFVWGLGHGGYHNFIMTQDKIYEGWPGITNGPNISNGFANFIKNWVAYGSYSDAQGWLIFPPDVSVSTSMVDNLNSLATRRVRQEEIVP